MHRPIRQLAGVALIIVCCGMAVCAQESPVFSGPQVGEKLVGFKTVGVYNEYKGVEFNPVAMADGKPMMLVFIHNVTRPAGDIARVLIHYGEMRKQDGLFSALVILTDDVTKSEQMMHVTQWFSDGSPVGLSLDGAEGPGAYGLNRNVMVTVLVANKNRVTANFAFVQPSLTDVPKILEAVHELVGGEIPTVPEIHFLQSPTRLGVSPKDVKLRQMICTLLRSHDKPDVLAKTVTGIDGYVDSDKDKQQQLGQAARVIVQHSYGGRDPIILAVPETRAILEAWSKKYPAPESHRRKRK